MSKTKKITIFFSSMSLIIMAYVLMLHIIVELKKPEVNLQEDNNIVSWVDDIAVSEGKITITGACFHLNYEPDKININVLLRSIEDEDKVVVATTTVHERTDICDYYENKRYMNAGFLSTVKENELGQDNVIYEIIIKLSYYENVHGAKIKNTVSVSTGKFVTSVGEYKINEKDFFRYEELRELLAQSIEVLSYDEFGISVYQKEGKLLFVADENFKFDEDKLSYIGCQVYSIDFDHNKDDMEWKRMDLSFYFENQEYKGDYGKYRIAQCSLENCNNIAYIALSQSDGKQIIWQDNININVCR